MGRHGVVRPDWGYVRIVDKLTDTLKPPLTVGRSTEFAECVFCNERRMAQPQRIRCHVGGIKTPVCGNVNPCKGVKRKHGETEEAFEQLQRQFLCS